MYSSFQMYSLWEIFVDDDGVMYPWVDPNECHGSCWVDFENPIEHGPEEPPLHYVYSDDEIPF